MRASDTPDPTSATIAGSLQSELGCPGDWQADCAATHLASDASDAVWQGTWTITLTGLETTAIQYKYTLGLWTYVEKDASCGEIGNRLLTLSYGTDGTQLVNDTVLNWWSVSPCGE